MMRPSSIALYRVHIPFRRPIEHANARRDFAENIILRCTSEDGVEGWGETIAREYVTGDTTDEIMARCRRLHGSLWRRSFENAGDVLRFCDEAELPNVARCAVEMALLDGLARSRKLPLDRMLASDWPSLAQIRNSAPFRYSGPLGVASPLKTAITAARLRAFGVRSVKVKLTGHQGDDLQRLRIARRILGAKTTILADANESWSLDHARRMAPILRDFDVKIIEQPFHKSKNAWAAEFYRLERIPLAFDESLCSEADARDLAGMGIAPVFAVKLAKLGGFHSTLRVLAVAAQQDIPIQISCQVGESAILSAAGRRLASLCPNLHYLEGSYDRFLLSDNVTEEDITVGKGGLAPSLPGHGLGIHVKVERVERLATEKAQLL